MKSENDMPTISLAALFFCTLLMLPQLMSHYVGQSIMIQTISTVTNMIGLVFSALRIRKTFW